jgi:hypothetical protein
MRRFSRPSAGTILGALALFVALGGTAMAAATVVNIADPTTPSRIAHVDSNGKLEVSDGGGSLTVDGTVNTQGTAPSNYVHVFGFANSTSGCSVVARPPIGKAMIVRDLRIDVYQDPSPGIGQLVAVYSDATCSTLVGDVNPSTVGETVLPFDPGLGIAANSGLSITAQGSVAAEAFTDGYSVPASQVPAVGAALSHTGPPHQQR